MGGRKDINRIKELIFGTEIQHFEEKFETLDNKLSTLSEKQIKFQKSVIKNFEKLETSINTLMLKDSSLAKELEHQTQKMNIHIEDTDMKIKMASKESKEQLKILKTELKMLIESKISGLDKAKISNVELSDMFASLSNELKGVGTVKQNVK